MLFILSVFWRVVVTHGFEIVSSTCVFQLVFHWVSKLTHPPDQDETFWLGNNGVNN